MSARNNWSRPPAARQRSVGGTTNPSVSRHRSQAAPTGRLFPRHTHSLRCTCNRESAHQATKPHTDSNTYRHARPPAPRQTPGRVGASLAASLPPFAGRNVAHSAHRAHPAPIPHGHGNRPTPARQPGGAHPIDKRTPPTTNPPPPLRATGGGNGRAIPPTYVVGC